MKTIARPVIGLLAALLSVLTLTNLAHAWSDPILVTPDSMWNRHSRVVFDNEDNIHFFFTSNRYHVDWYDVFHCKFSRSGVRLTEDVRLDTSDSYWEVYPSPLLGSDNKLHIVWADIITPP